MTAVELFNRICYSWYKIFHFIGYGILDGISNWMFRHLIYPIPFMKRRYAKFGMGREDVIKYCDNAMDGQKDFMVSSLVNTTMFSVPFFILLILSNLIQYAYGVLPHRYLLFELIILAIGAWLSCHFVLWKNNMYIGYFREFEKESPKKRTAWCIGTIILYILLTVVWFFSMSLIY